MEIPHSDFCLVSDDGVPLERDKAVEIRNRVDLENAVTMLHLYFYEAQLRGDPILLELWSPALNERMTTYHKKVTMMKGEQCSPSPSKTAELFSGYSEAM